jgi:hypothetical protein
VNERELPPVTQLAMASLALVVAAGIYLSAHLPEHVPLAPAIVLVALAALLLVGNVALLARAPGFPWPAFFAVARWALLGYAVIAGMIEYVFLRNNVSGGVLAVLTAALVLFAVHVPLLIGFTVARYADAAPRPGAEQH